MRKFVRIDREGDIGTTFFGLSRLAFGKSRHNTIEILHSPTYGKILFLNNEIMNAERDEVLYHEPLVHLPMAHIEHPKTALVFGGGTLNVVREILKYRTIMYVLMIEVDRLVVEKVISNYGGKRRILSDNRLEVVYGDAYKIIEEIEENFDLIINDAKDLMMYSGRINFKVWEKKDKGLTAYLTAGDGQGKTKTSYSTIAKSEWTGDDQWPISREEEIKIKKPFVGVSIGKEISDKINVSLTGQVDFYDVSGNANLIIGELNIFIMTSA